jgi:hypothetical protein
MRDSRSERDPLAGLRVPPPDADLRARTLVAARAALERRAAPGGWRAAFAALRAAPALASLVALLLLAHAALFLVPASPDSARAERLPAEFQALELAASAPEVAPLPRVQPLTISLDS